MGEWSNQVEGAVEWRRDPAIVVALGMVVGVVLGRIVALPGVWLSVGAIAAGGAAWMFGKGRERGVWCWGMVAVVGLSAAWGVVRGERVREDSVLRYLGEEPRLAEVTGAIEGSPWLKRKQDGPFAGFGWEPPATGFVVAVEEVDVGGVREAASGRLMVRIDEAEHRLRSGQRVRMTGWLAAVMGPMNPGEFDYRASMLERGIVARLTMPGRGNCEIIGEAPASPIRWLHDVRAAVQGAALESLGLGMEDRPREHGLLRTLLLGVWSDELRDIEDEFRAVGLTHVL